MASPRESEQAPRRVSRRTLIAGGAGVAALGIGATAWATSPPPPSFTHGTHPGVGRGRVLVAYDSQYSTTGGVADVIAQTLAQAGPTVDVRHLRAVEGLTGYDAVVVGAPVHTNKWKAPATTWLGDHARDLADVPVAQFLTSMSYALGTDRAREDAEKNEWLRRAAETAGVRTVAQRPFAGAVDPALMGWAAAGIYMAASRTTTLGDFRDWGAIRDWAGTLPGPLGLA